MTIQHSVKGIPEVTVALNQYSPHVARINEYVDRLRHRSNKSVPYVGADMGGAEAPILSVLSDPGPFTQRSQVLSTTNGDPTSRVQRRLMEQVGLDQSDLCPWNAYPYEHDPTVDGSLLDVLPFGAVALADIVPMMESLKVVLLQGSNAQRAWGMLRAFRPLYADPSFAVVATMHPLGTRHRDAERAAALKTRQLADWTRAAELARA